MPKHRSSLEGNLTWQQAIDYITEMGKMIYEIFHDQNGALDIAIFRESVIKCVLQEYELLGAAYTFAERQSLFTHDKPKPDKDDPLDESTHEAPIVLEIINMAVNCTEKLQTNTIAEPPSFRI